MSRKKKNRNQDDKALKVILLVTALIQLISAVASLMEKLLE